MTTILQHVGLVVTDAARSRHFYEEVFGFVHDRDLHMPAEQLGMLQLDTPSDIHAVYLMLGSFTLELMVFKGTKPSAGDRVFNMTGLTHLSLAVDDIPTTLEKAKALGGEVLTDIGLAAVFRDPDGQLVEIVSMAFDGDVAKGRAERAAARRSQ